MRLLPGGSENLHNDSEELTSQTSVLEEVGETHFGEVEKGSVGD
jgi:hypothetical protein